MRLPAAESVAGLARPRSKRAGRAEFGRLGRLAAWVGIVVLILYMTVGEGSGWYGVYSAVLRVFTLCCLVVVFATWAVVAWHSPTWRPRSALAVPIVAALGAFVVTSVTSSNTRISLEYTAYAMLLAGLYLLLLRLIASDFFRPRLFVVVALLCAGIGIWYLWTVAGLWATWWGLVGRFAIPPLRPAMDGLVWRSPNTVAIMVILLLPPVLAYFGFGTRARRVGLAALTILTLAVVFISGSRGAWLGLAVGIVVTAGVWVAVPGNRALLRRTVAGLPLRRGPLVAIAILAVAAVAVAAPQVASRAAAGGEDIRSGLLVTASRMFTADPIVGSGPGMWVVRRIQFLQPGELDYYIPHAHNVFAQALAEFGVMGIVAGIILVVWLLGLIVDGIRDADAARRRFAWGSLFSLVYFGAHQLVDVYVGLPCVLFALALSVGYLDATSRRSVLRAFGVRVSGAGARPAGTATTASPGEPLRALAVEQSMRRPAGVAGLVAFAVGIVIATSFLAWSESNALPAEQAVGSSNDGNWSDALTSARAAAAGDRAMPAYAFIEGVAAAHTGDASLAMAAFARSAAADDFPLAWLNLAAERAVLGEPAATREAVVEALRLGRQQPSIAFGAGSLYLQLGDTTAATDAFGAAITAAPTLATDPFFAAGGAGAALKTAALTRAMASWDSDAWEPALLAGDTAEAQRRAETLRGPLHDQALLIVAAWNGDATARAQLATQATASPLDYMLISWNGRLARRVGDVAGAARYQSWADMLLAGGGAIALTLRTTPGTALARGDGATDRSVYGLYTYRRPMPVDMLAPSLPRLRLE